MRRIVWFLLLLYVFAVPWEYSLELGEPVGNIARLVGVLLLLAAIPAVLAEGHMRTPGPMQILVLAFFLWYCLTCFWSIDSLTTLTRLRAFFQEMMIVWLLWEYAENASDLRSILRATVAGSWVLAVLTVANFASAQALAIGQTRFAATGQDPNDVARFLDLGFPLAALLVNSESRWPARLLSLGYLPLGLVAVLLTASRGGFLAALVSLAGSAFLLLYRRPRRLFAAALALPLLLVVLWFSIPHVTFARLATISEQLNGGDLNQRMNIWIAGWHAFQRAPFLGTGAGSFVAAAGLAPFDTAHNTALAIVVTGGLCGLFLASAIVALDVWLMARIRGPLGWALATALTVWTITSMVASVEEGRSTWLLMGLIALAARLAAEEPQQMADCFPVIPPENFV
jgi:O-antigen ligase